MPPSAPECPYCRSAASAGQVIGADPPVESGRHTFVNYHILCRCDRCRRGYIAYKVRPVAADTPTPYPPRRAGPPG